MLAMLRQTPSSSSSGLRESRARSRTCTACSIPWSEKYCASVERIACVEATSAFTVIRPRVGGQSIRIRSLLRRRSRSALRSVTSRPIFPARTSSASASRRFAGTTRPCTASAARACPWRTSPSVGWRVRVGVEVVGEVALGVGVDRQHVHPEALEDVRQRADHGRLSGAPLLGQDGDRFGHRPDYMAVAALRSAADACAPPPGLYCASALSPSRARSKKARKPGGPIAQLLQSSTAAGR